MRPPRRRSERAVRGQRRRRDRRGLLRHLRQHLADRVHWRRALGWGPAQSPDRAAVRSRRGLRRHRPRPVVRAVLHPDRVAAPWAGVLREGARVRQQLLVYRERVARLAAPKPQQGRGGPDVPPPRWAVVPPRAVRREPVQGWRGRAAAGRRKDPGVRQDRARMGSRRHDPAAIVVAVRGLQQPGARRRPPVRRLPRILGPVGGQVGAVRVAGRRRRCRVSVPSR